MTPLFGFYDDLERYSSTVNSNFVLNIPYTLLREIFIKWETEQKKYILPKEENKMSFGELSAVEWLHNKWGNCKVWKWEEIEQWFKQAKEMEKQQIIDAYNKSFELRDKPYSTANKYYNETYGSKGSDDINTLTSNPIDYQNHSNMSDNFKQFSLYEHKETIATADTPTPSQTEISDEEIEKRIKEVGAMGEYYKWGYRDAIIWYIEQLKCKGNGNK